MFPAFLLLPMSDSKSYVALLQRLVLALQVINVRPAAAGLRGGVIRLDDAARSHTRRLVAGCGGRTVGIARVLGRTR